ncbi:MAG: sulfur carrier protein ThiS [Rhodanobacter sp.]
MHILVNGVPHEVLASNCSHALEELGYAQTIVATALNGTFLSASERENIALSDGDALEILAPMQGG